MHKIYFLQSHAIQYHSPLYDLFTQQENIDFKVFYCSDYGLESSGKRYHPEFGELPNWDINLVKGHPHEILKNYAIKKGIFSGFFGLVNWGIYKKLKKEKPNLLIVLGWNYFSLVYAVICCKLLNIKVYVRGDNTLDFDKGLSPIKRNLKKFYFGIILFPLYTKIGYVGEKNKTYFLSYGVPEKKLINLPHSIDNSKFSRFSQLNFTSKRKMKTQLGIPAGFTLLFVGRLMKIKGVIDLLTAFSHVKGELELVFVGDGPEKESLIDYAKINELSNFKITGFQNQKDILNYYLVADAIVLPSYSETWGLVINEAMNFNLPVIVSDQVGCSQDLATATNGFIFPVGDKTKLAACIQFLVDNPEKRKEMGEESFNIIKNYSYPVIIGNIINSIK